MLCGALGNAVCIVGDPRRHVVAGLDAEPLGQAAPSGLLLPLREEHAEAGRRVAFHSVCLRCKLQHQRVAPHISRVHRPSPSTSSPLANAVEASATRSVMTDRLRRRVARRGARVSRPIILLVADASDCAGGARLRCPLRCACGYSRHDPTARGSACPGRSLPERCSGAGREPDATVQSAQPAFSEAVAAAGCGIKLATNRKMPLRLLADFGGDHHTCIWP